MTHESIDEIVDDLLADLPLQEQVTIANMTAFDVSVLQTVLGAWLQAPAGSDGTHADALTRLWHRLRKTHRLRVVK